MTDKLNTSPPNDALRTREGTGGKTFTYLPGWYVIKTANEIFGHGGWGHDTRECKVVDISQGTNKWGDEVWDVAAYAIVDVVAGETHHSGVGAASSRSGNKAEAIENALKAAETDALKRALKNWGNAFGLSLYEDEPSEPVAQRNSYESAPQQSTPPRAGSGKLASDKQKGFLATLIKKAGIKEVDRFANYVLGTEDWQTEASSKEVSEIISSLKDNDEMAKDLIAAFKASGGV